MSHDIECPFCGIELTVAQLFAHAETQCAVAGLAAVSVPLGARVLKYCALFAPKKTRLTVSKQVKLILQLLPDLQRQAITHKGRDWSVPLDVWAQGIDQMLASRDAGRLELPMTGHAYLYSILAGMADKVEGRAEAQAEADKRRSTAHAFDTQLDELKVSTMTIGRGMAQVYSGRDPVLAQDENHRKASTPAPAYVQALRDGLRRKPSPTSGEQA